MTFTTTTTCTQALDNSVKEVASNITSAIFLAHRIAPTIGMVEKDAHEVFLTLKQGMALYTDTSSSEVTQCYSFIVACIESYFTSVIAGDEAFGVDAFARHIITRSVEDVEVQWRASLNLANLCKAKFKLGGVQLKHKLRTVFDAYSQYDATQLMPASRLLDTSLSAEESTKLMDSIRYFTPETNV